MGSMAHSLMKTNAQHRQWQMADPIADSLDFLLNCEVMPKQAGLF